MSGAKMKSNEEIRPNRTEPKDGTSERKLIRRGLDNLIQYLNASASGIAHFVRRLDSYTTATINDGAALPVDTIEIGLRLVREVGIEL